MTAKKDEIKMIRYLLSTRGGKDDFIIEVPADFKLTFGYVNPAGSKDGYNRGDAHCVRVWDGTKLRAVYGDVVGLRDMSIPLARKVHRETGNASWTMDSQGNFEESKSVAVESHLVLEAGDEPVFDGF